MNSTTIETRFVTRMPLTGRFTTVVLSSAFLAGLAATALAKPPEAKVRYNLADPQRKADGVLEEPDPKPVADLKGPRPIIKAENDVHDFGAVWVGPQLKHTFTIRNEGDAALDISAVRPSCGCTIAGDYPKKLDPGQSGQFPFQMNSTKLHGSFAKHVTVTCNDPVTPNLRLTLRGEVKQYVDVTPQTATFGRITDQEPKNREVMIINNTEKPLELELKPEPGDPFKYKLEEVDKGRRYALKVSMEPPYKEGSMNAAVRIATNVDDQKEIVVRTIATVPPRLEVQPNAILISERGEVESGQPIARMLRYTNYGKTPAKLVEATVDDPLVSVAVRERKEGEAYTVEVQLPPGYRPPAEGKTITLKLEDNETPEIKIPIRGMGRQNTMVPPAEQKLAVEPATIEVESAVGAQLASAQEPAKPAPAPSPAANPPAVAPPLPKPAAQRVRPDDLVGKPAPAFSLKTVDGKEVSSDTLKDSPATVLNFFANNCGFCKKQIPRLETIRKEFAAKGVRFINVTETMRQEFTEDQTKETMKSVGWEGEVAMDPKNEVGPLFGATGYPTMVVLGKSGKVEAVNVGNIGDLETRVRGQVTALAEGKPIPTEFVQAPKQPERPPGPESKVGTPAPAFSLKTIDGKDVSNDTVKDTAATVLNFYANNCGYCKKQIPRLETVQKEYEGKPVRFINVAMTMGKEFTQEETLATLKEVGWTDEVARDPKNEVGPKFGVSGFPTMVVVGKSGKVQAVHVGNVGDLESQLKGQLDQLIAGKEIAQAPAPGAAAPAAPKRRPAEELVGQTAPEFSLKTMDGKTVASAEFSKSKATVLNFVAPNCGFCKKQVPNVDKVRAEYESKGVRFVNVAMKMGAKEFTDEEIAKIFKEAGSSLELAKDEGNAVGQKYKAMSYPTMIVVSSDGKIAHVNVGAKPDIENLLKGQLDALVK